MNSTLHQKNLKLLQTLEDEGLSLEDFVEMTLERKLIECGVLKTESFDGICKSLENAN